MLQKLEPKKSPFQKLGYLLNEKQRLMPSRSSIISQTPSTNGTKFDGKGFCFIVVGNKKHDILILTATMRKDILQR
ncbi:MAG TPA: hypothetical protein VFI70_14050 [Nitrososphaeraceae archaeon]|nr:hypothetical protein [Nitrososphaeraceae archaeon]